MKNLLIILTAISASAAQIEPAKEEPSIQIVQTIGENVSGRDTIHSIRTSYETGAYDDFLEESDQYYKEILEGGQLEQLVHMRMGFSPVWEELEGRALLLSQEKNKELKIAVENEKNTPFIEKVLFVSDELSDEAHQNAIKRIAHFRMMQPGSGTNGDENRLIDIDLEYEFKALHLDMPISSVSGKMEKHAALKMEQLDKIRDAAAHFEDESLKEAVSLYADHFDARLAQSLDLMDLHQLINGKAKPANAVEEKVASILDRYIEKFSDLSRSLLAEGDATHQ